MTPDQALQSLAPREPGAANRTRKLPRTRRGKPTPWGELLQHAASATSPHPSGKWLKEAARLLDALGPDVVGEALARGLPDVTPTSLGPTWTEEQSLQLRGLLWMVPLLPTTDPLMRAVAGIGLAAYKKIPGVGPRAGKIGNAAIYALSELKSAAAVGQLAVLKTRIKFGAAQKVIEKAYTKAAEALGVPRDQIEEFAVPTYGLSADRTRQAVGDYTAEISITGGDAGLSWTDAKGKLLKSAPAKVKTEHPEAVQELRQKLKDIQAMLPAQRDRIEGMFLKSTTWKVELWRERYLDHPLVGTIARRLLWSIDGTPALFVKGRPTDPAGKTIPHGRTAEITLWHPVGRPIEEVLAWRRRLEALGITQPFKQAHREVYLLTDAERRTSPYSNRFAAHVLRQHQFNALCTARGWKNQLRLIVDDCCEPPYKLLPAWGLRAEFWVEGIPGEEGVDLSDAGVYLRLTTDQVRFYRLQAAPNFAHITGGGYATLALRRDRINDPLPLEQIPRLAFSEVMRDVDLFVGVCSIGADPTWHDGGPQGRFLDYWRHYSFGELSGTANTRKEALQRLIPRLSIAPRCSFTERFLVVRGDLRTYKIHLGSGNILMEPNDQYLCIVPDASARANNSRLHLPFEGDSTLSIILSKALLLADDRKIKDPTITHQIATFV